MSDRLGIDRVYTKMQSESLQQPPVQKLRISILAMAAEQDLDSADVAEALALVLATIAVAKYNQTGKKTLKDDLHSFCKQVEQDYHRNMIVNETIVLGK